MVVAACILSSSFHCHLPCCIFC